MRPQFNVCLVVLQVEEVKRGTGNRSQCHGFVWSHMLWRLGRRFQALAVVAVSIAGSNSRARVVLTQAA